MERGIRRQHGACFVLCFSGANDRFGSVPVSDLQTLDERDRRHSGVADYPYRYESYRRN